MKKFILALNFKNNLVSTKEYLSCDFSGSKNLEIIVFPSFLQIGEFRTKKAFMKIGAQNVQENNFTITGEISAQMLKKFGTKYCLVGHSERNESIEQNTNKINELLSEKITPILCVGECEKMPFNQSIVYIKNLLDEIRKFGIDFSKIIVAYEPIYSIGNEESCELVHIEKIVNFLKQNYCFLGVLYGGSVNTKNFEKISKIGNLDGVLIGKNSLKPKNIENMIEILKK